MSEYVFRVKNQEKNHDYLAINAMVKSFSWNDSGFDQSSSDVIIIRFRALYGEFSLLKIFILLLLCWHAKVFIDYSFSNCVI